MSFFHEPPPLDSDIPPPLDDKLRDSDFDLEIEEIIEDNSIHNCIDLPELPDVLDCVGGDGNISCAQPPPKLPDFVISSSPPPDEGNFECNVVNEKESVVLDQTASNDENADKIACAAIKENVIENFEISNESKAVDESSKEKLNDIPWKENVTTNDSLQSSENILEDSEFDDFTGFKSSNDNIPSILELKLDNDEDFSDFENAIPMNRQVGSNISNEENETATSQEIHFEADFSAFNVFDEQFKATEKIEEFHEFEAAAVESKYVESVLKTQSDDDDDDFGDFSDFTQASAPLPTLPTSSIEAVAFVKPQNVNGILDMMFPPTSPVSERNFENYTKEEVIKHDGFVNKFNDFDSTLALGYLYSNSRASQTLVKALGIDTRNILLGPQWASASSSMPRFATNMSFNPIEPLKPQTLSFPSSAEPAKSTILQPLKVKSDMVPDPPEFDWSCSGLVNPLDGPQPKSQQQHEPTLVHQPPASSAHTLENESPFLVVDQEVPQVFEAETKANAGYKPELNDTTAAYQWSGDTQQHHLSSSNILIRERTIKLPETHIFTPVKGTSPIAREVVSREPSPIPDDSYSVSKGSIVVKEYHDVEYSLEPKKKSDPDTDFDEFQSAQPTTSTSDLKIKKPLEHSEKPTSGQPTAKISKSNPPLLPLNVLEPHKIETSAKTVKQEAVSNVQFSNDLNFLDTSVTVDVSKTYINLPLPPPPFASSLAAPALHIKSVIGSTPTEKNGDDDDFNDFQAAPTVKFPPKVEQSNDPITLSPARLVMQTNQKATWISANDDDEISRYEAAFPKCKPDKKKLNDDDDWSDFVAVQPSSLPYTQTLPPSMISSNTMGKFPNCDGDDWSDFVSAPPTTKIPSGAFSSQLQSKPNFSSWDQPIGKHHFVNHSTSFLTNEPRYQNQSLQFTSNNSPYVTEKFAKGSITITDNFSYTFNPEIAMGSISNHNHHHQQQKKPNGISTILPELDFAMPKTLMNLPRGGNSDNGKK